MISNDGSRASIRSIEHSLELERQLALEAETPPHSPPGHGIRPQSLDPSILASLVTSLTAERDSLASALEASKEREEQLRVELHRHLERVATQDEELEGLKSKNAESEESIALLRSKVEDSRRALMRLQTENRRVHGAGNMSVDLSRTSSFSFGGPPSAKRASFTPLAGSPRGHARRPSNISTTDSPLDSLQSMRSRQLPAAEVLPDGSSLLSLPVNHPEYAESTVQSPRSPYLRPDVDAQQKEIQTLRSMLEEIRSELAEANEAREASDTCVKALREFITEHNIGTSPLPAMPQVPAPRTSTQSKPATGTGSTRWGFGLWRTSESSPPSPPSRSSVSQLGGIFGSRQSGSVSIVPSTLQDRPQATHDQASDSSSVESPEPASPSDSQRISRGAIISAPSAPAHPSAKIPTESPGPITVITL